VLVFPAEASHASLSRSFKDRGLHDFAVNSAVGQLRLSLGDRDQCRVVNGFHKSIPQGVEGGAQCADIFCCRDVFLSFRTDRAIIDDGASRNRIFAVVDKDSRVNEVAVFVIVSDPEFRELAGSPAIRILMATDAALRVISRSKSIGDRFVLLVDLLIPSNVSPAGSTIPLLMLCAPLKLGVLKPAGASLVDFAATLASPVPNAATRTTTQEERRSFLPLGMSMTVPPRKNQLPTLAFKHRSTDRSRILKVATETIETYGLGVRKPCAYAN
jgi:hypothetical protein